MRQRDLSGGDGADVTCDHPLCALKYSTTLTVSPSQAILALMYTIMSMEVYTNRLHCITVRRRETEGTACHARTGRRMSNQLWRELVSLVTDALQMWVACCVGALEMHASTCD